MQITMQSGDQALTALFPTQNVLGTLTAGDMPAATDERALLSDALEHPIASARLRDIVRPGEKIAILTSDKTRPLPTSRVLPCVLDALFAAGARAEDITVYFALGSHRHQTEEEMRRLMGASFGLVACEDANPDDTVYLGTTSRGTPVEIARKVALSDRRVCLGNIEYHYFAGFSGGVKALVPGAASRRTIQANHSLMTLPGAETGRLDGNPVRADLEEAGALCGIDFILNVVLDEEKRIARAFAGNATEAHRAGCRYLAAHYAVPIAQKADLVIVSQGGAPKDLNLYQAQKAISNAERAVKAGGVILLVASCREGAGNETFASWLREAQTSEEIIARLERGFQLGGHKAAALARTLRTAELWAVTDMPDALAASYFLRPFATLQQAADAALSRFGADMTAWLMPHGGSTLPQYAP